MGKYVVNLAKRRIRDAEYRKNYTSSDHETRNLKQVTKPRENFYDKGSDVNLEELWKKLLLYEFNYNPLVGFDGSSRFTKKIRIVEIYPKVVIGEYFLGNPDRPQHRTLIGFGVADLIELGILTFVHGYPEVVKR